MRPLAFTHSSNPPNTRIVRYCLPLFLLLIKFNEKPKSGDNKPNLNLRLGFTNHACLSASKTFLSHLNVSPVSPQFKYDSTLLCSTCSPARLCSCKVYFFSRSPFVRTLFLRGAREVFSKIPRHALFDARSPLYKVQIRRMCEHYSYVLSEPVYFPFCFSSSSIKPHLDHG